jgi:GntR family transcriptional regulator
MVHDGYLTSTRGRGVFVREFKGLQSKESVREAALLVKDCIDACKELGLTDDEIGVLTARQLRALRDEDIAHETAARKNGARENAPRKEGGDGGRLRVVGGVDASASGQAKRKGGVA